MFASSPFTWGWEDAGDEGEEEEAEDDCDLSSPRPLPLSEEREFGVAPPPDAPPTPSMLPPPGLPTATSIRDLQSAFGVGGGTGGDVSGMIVGHRRVSWGIMDSIERIRGRSYGTLENMVNP